MNKLTGLGVAMPKSLSKRPYGYDTLAMVQHRVAVGAYRDKTLLGINLV